MMSYSARHSSWLQRNSRLVLRAKNDLWRFTTSTQGTNRPDPFARRPNQICDPYGQGGKPLNFADANNLLQTTVEPGWKLVSGEGDNPERIEREFFHHDYMTASQFISKIAAVGHMNNHFPSVALERRLLPREKSWQVVTTIGCVTPTLAGLSHNDFHIAMMIDVELANPSTKCLILASNESKRKHT